ncbi:MAG TPA: M24 family metallopeptidase [Bacteroidia bacterium]|nr:M24 family metallopeptidase [Bacteroidia bacterium]
MVRTKLLEAEKIAMQLFKTVEMRNLIVAGKSENELNEDIFKLADELFGIKKYWHKRIVRSGINTLVPYDDNPPDLILQEDDILFLDFGPIIEDWEGDFGRTYVIGNDPDKYKLKNDIELAWHEAKNWFDGQTKLTGAEFHQYIVELAVKYGYAYGGQLAGHLIGHFPHERLEPKNYGLYVHPENPNDMFLPDANGNKRHWILEIHFVDREKKIGGFFEQLLT